jgi:hypothetical protein
MPALKEGRGVASAEHRQEDHYSCAPACLRGVSTLGVEVEETYPLGAR